MQLQEGGGSPWPGIDNDEELLEKLAGKMDWTAPVFGNREEFLDANTAQGENE